MVGTKPITTSVFTFEKLIGGGYVYIENPAVGEIDRC
jgi:hypothetical protein